MSDETPNTKQRFVFNELRREILDGRYATGRFTSERSLMKRFAVSRTLVREVIRELKFAGYLTCRQGSGTFVTKGARNLGGHIGLIVPGVVHEEIFPPICRAISDIAQKEGFTLLLGNITEEDGMARARRVKAIVNEFVAQRVSGVIYQPMEFLGNSPKVNADLIALFDRANIPVVLLDYDIVPPPGRSRYDLVGIDNFEAGRRLAAHLVSVGAKRIAFMLKDNWAFSVLNRLEGVRHVAAEARRLATSPVLHVEPTDVKAVRAVLHRKNPPDAIVCGNDMVAARLLVTLRKLGVSVPKTVMVAGFDDVAHAALVEPPLTTVRQPCSDIARTLFEVLLRRMRDSGCAPVTVSLNAPLVVRLSTKPPRNH